MYRFTIEKNGDYASGTIELNDDGVATAADDTESTETLDAMKKRMAEEEENGTQSIMKGSDGNSYMINSGKRYVEITLDYLPEGVVQPGQERIYGNIHSGNPVEWTVEYCDKPKHRGCHSQTGGKL